MRTLEALSRPLSALRVPRPQVLPKVADAPAGYEAADVALGNLGGHPHITSALRGGELTQSQSRWSDPVSMRQGINKMCQFQRTSYVAWSLLLRLCFVLVAAVVLEAGDVEEALPAHVAGELGKAVRGVPGGHVLVEVQLQLIED